MFRLSSKSHISKVTSALLTRHTKPAKAPMMALSDSHPVLVSGWIGGATSKFDTPQTLNPSSCKLSWWKCAECSAQFRRKVLEHVAVGGQCPHCKHVPASSPSSSPFSPDHLSFTVASPPAASPAIARPIRTKATGIAAFNPKAIKRHITDISYFANNAMLRKMLQPMLAKPFEVSGHRVKFGKEDVFISPKIDGIRCLVACDPTALDAESGEPAIYYFSRQGVLFDSCEHLDATMRAVFKQDPTAILDGELYYNGPTPTSDRMPFEQLLSTVSTTLTHRTEAVKKLQSLVQYHAFDIAYSDKLWVQNTAIPNNTDIAANGKGFTERYSFLESLHKQALIFREQQSAGACGSPSSSSSSSSASASLLQLVPARHVTSIVEAFQARDAFISDGYEGAMLRCGKATYGHGKRSASLLKMKCMQDAEFQIVGAVEGQGKMANTLGAFVCCTADGSTFTVSPSVDEARRKAMWSDVDSFIGSALTVQFQELSSHGIPRFPVGKAIRGSSMAKSTWV